MLYLYVQAYPGRWKLDYSTEKAKQEFVPPTEFIVIYAALGEKDQAFELLEQAYDEHEGTLWLLKVSPKYDPLRDDPRFHDLLRRMNLLP